MSAISGTVRGFAGHRPSIAPDCFVGEGAVLIGQVILEPGSSVWFNAVLRGDSEPIRLGPGSNVQDNCTLHVDPGLPCTIGSGVTIGHNAVVHACTLEDNVLIGMHATILSGAVIGRDTVVGAGALVAEGVQIPPGSLVLGIPGRVVRPLRPDEIAKIAESAKGYQARARKYGGEAIV